MEFKNEFKISNSKYIRGESFNSLYDLGTSSIEKMETRVPEDDNENSSQFSLKDYLSQIKSNSSSKEFDLNLNKYEETTSFKPVDPPKIKPLNKFERFQKLEKSLSGIQSNVELKRSSILEDIYQKINKLETKISDSELCSSRKIDLISKRIENIETAIEGMTKKHEDVLNEKANVIDSICEKFHQSLSQEQETWKAGEKNIIYSINEQINSVKNEISDMNKIKSEIISNIKVYTDSELPRFRTKIESSKNEIYKMEDKIIKNTSEDLVTLANFIKEENEKMYDLKDKMITHLNTELNNLKFDIKQECEERQVTQNKLISLMEETIKRLGSPL